MPPIPKPLGVSQRHSKRPSLELVPRAAPEIIPKAPAGLGPVARKLWRSYWHSPVSQIVDLDTDQHRLSRWIRAVDEYEKTSAVFIKARMVKGSTGQPVMNPLAGYLQSLKGEIAECEQVLGLDPLSRLKLGIVYGEAQMSAKALNDALNSGRPPAGAAPKVEAWEGEFQPV